MCTDTSMTKMKSMYVEGICRWVAYVATILLIYFVWYGETKPDTLDSILNLNKALMYGMFINTAITYLSALYNILTVKKIRNEIKIENRICVIIIALNGWCLYQYANIPELTISISTTLLSLVVFYIVLSLLRPYYLISWRCMA